MVRILLALFLAALSLPAEKLPFDVDGLLKLHRISQPQVSPDGRAVAFTVETPDVAANTKHKQIWLVAVDGSTPRALTSEGNNDTPRWAPDSKSLAFVSSRGGSSQIWLMQADGSQQHALTTIASEASGVVWTPDGKNLLFLSEVYPECKDEACNKSRLDADRASKVKARIYDELFYRHWDHWNGPRRTHLFVAPSGGGAPRDLTPAHTVEGSFTVAPDSTEVCFEANADPVRAVSTNSDLFVVPLAGGEIKKITVNPAADSGPQYSPDAKYLAYRSQQRPGYESDRWRLMLLERATGKVIALTEGTDRWVEAFTWTPDSTQLFFVTGDRGHSILQRVSPTGGAARIVINSAGHLEDLQFTPDAKTLLFTENRLTHPTELFKIQSSGGPPVPLARLNDETLAGYSLPAAEEAWADSPDQARVQYFLLKPAGFTAGRKYPVLFLIHGGPQGAWGESWTYRWNAEVFAAAGYVVVMPNPRGSTGYGQKFTDEINADWGGRAYNDVMAVVDKVSALPFTDRDRMAAAGGSYGGYLVNWILGHSTRFKALISHAGVFDLRSMFGATEELWFPIWEYQGTPWENPELYARWSPSYFAKEFQTPTLVIHGELDFRVPYTQGLQLYTTLQMRKVPSRLLVFPDEGHWINKPQNAQLWYKTFIEWINKYTAPAPPPVPVGPVAPAPAK